MAKRHTAGRLIDVAQAARGREPQKYELEVIPFFAGELPSGLGKVCFTWERGSKVFTTSAEAVNPATRAVFWQQFLKQTATMYREQGRLLPKEYSFKIQHVRSSGGSSSDEASRKTIGKCKVDMAQFCSHDTASVPQEVYLQLKPAGKLKVSIKATWLKDARIDADALTEVSFGTHRSTEAGEQYDEQDEQDLSGFDHFDEAAQRTSSQTGTSGSPRNHASIPAYRAGAGPGGALAAADVSLSVPGRAGTGGSMGSPRSSKAGPAAAGSKLKPPGLAVAGSTAPFSVGLSPQAQLEREVWLAEERTRQEAFQAAESAKIRRTIEDQLRVELNEVLAQHSGINWRSIFCCCWPKRQARLRTTQELATLQREDTAGGDTGLLSAAPLPL